MDEQNLNPQEAEMAVEAAPVAPEVEAEVVEVAPEVEATEVAPEEPAA